MRRAGWGWLAAGLALLPAPRGWAEPPLAYRFAVGDRLVYERRANVSSLAGQGPARQVVEQIQLWCLEERDGETVILFDLARSAGGPVEPLRGVVLSVDSRGRRWMPEVTPVRATELEAALEVVPCLPAALEEGPVWHTPPDLTGLGRQCTRATAPDEHGGQRVDYIVEYPAGIGELLGRSHTGRYWFDREAGVVTRIESLSQDRTADHRTEAVTILRQRQVMPAGWIGRRAQEARQFLQTLRHEDRLLEQVVCRPAQFEQTLERLHRLWVGRLVDFEGQAGSPLDLLARARLKRLPAEAAALRADAVFAGRWLGRPAVTWSLQTVSGDTLTSEQARAGVVIECIWSVDEPGFPATLAALRAVQSKLPAGRGRVVCLNLDADVHRARRVLERLPADLTHVLAGPLRAVDDPPRLPLVRVLDRQGVIRRMWLGWRPSYAEALEEALRWAD